MFASESSFRSLFFLRFLQRNVRKAANLLTTFGHLLEGNVMLHVAQTVVYLVVAALVLVFWRNFYENRADN